jgi:putative FmdB family regulatory protein
MPIYEYHCADCGTTFEALVRGSKGVMHARDQTCPECGGASLEKLLSAPIMLSGRTSRPAGSTCCGRAERCNTPPCSDDGACRRD